MTLAYLLLYITILVVWAFWLPPMLFDPYQKKLIFILAVVAIWRYAWFINNAARAYYYRKVKFRKLREAEEAGGEEYDPDHVFLLITTFRIGTAVSVEVYRAAVQEAIDCGYDVTIIASVVEMSEERLVRRIYQELDPPTRVELVITRIKGTGKRDALAAGYRVVANRQVDRFRSILAVIDGDSIISKGLIRKCTRLFMMDPELGGLTTDEDPKLIGKLRTLAEHTYYRWYRLRFAQRNVAMSSLALSGKVLTLTGRMSMVRASISSEREFIDTVQADYIDHWRLGRFKFVTGDDKSSWFHLAREGWKILYVPDVMVYTVEEIVSDNFFLGSLELMTRWFGNQYRTNARAMAIPDDVIGRYARYALWDQRVTKWTAPYGLAIAIFGAISWGGYVLFAYLWWIMLTRLLMTFLYRLSRKDFMMSWPFLLYYNQIVGSFVKIYIWNHLYKQGWTRQKTGRKKGGNFLEWYYKTSSNGMMAFELLIFVIIVNFVVQLLTYDDIWNFLHAIGG